MRAPQNGIEAVLSRVVMSTSILAVLWSAYGAIHWESFSLAAGALYQLAVVTLYGSSFDGFTLNRGARGQGENKQLAIVVVLLIPSPFLAGGAVHALNHASNLAPIDLMPLATCAFAAGALRGFYSCCFSRTRGALVLVQTAVCVLPFLAPLLLAGLIAAGLENVDGVVGIGLIAILLATVLAPQLSYVGRLFD